MHLLTSKAGARKSEQIIQSWLGAPQAHETYQGESLEGEQAIRVQVRRVMSNAAKWAAEVTLADKWIWASALLSDLTLRVQKRMRGEKILT